MSQAKKKSRGRTTGSSSFFFDEFLALAETLANRRKDWAADQIADFTVSVRDFTSSVKVVPNFDNIMSPVVESVEEFSDYIRETEFDEILRDSATFAKRHPVVTIGSGLLVGAIAIQVLRSNGSGQKTTGDSKASGRTSKASKPRKTAVARSSKANGHAHANA